MVPLGHGRGHVDLRRQPAAARPGRRARSAAARLAARPVRPRAGVSREPAQRLLCPESLLGAGGTGRVLVAAAGGGAGGRRPGPPPARSPHGPPPPPTAVWRRPATLPGGGQ